MPLFDFKCQDCGVKNEHFVHLAADKLTCPSCHSDNYRKVFGKFRVDVQYANTREYVEKKLNPDLKEMYAQIGKEALDEDSKTLDNIFGDQRVKDTYGESES